MAPSPKAPLSIFWFRRDLRLKDNTALFHALRGQHPVLCIFIFDTDILSRLTEKADARVEFILNSLNVIQKHLNQHDSSLVILKDKPADAWEVITRNYNVKSVYFNHDTEPYPRKRDQAISEFLQSKGIAVHSFKDQCIFEKSEIAKASGQPYTVFTPYFKQWRAHLDEFSIQSYKSETLLRNLLKSRTETLPTLSDLGFSPAGIPIPEPEVNLNLIKRYAETRDFPAIRGTTRLGVHLRFGTISVRSLVRLALEQSEVFISEIAWRDFFMTILFHFPYSCSKAFKPAYDKISWRDDPEGFAAWCAGKTGYPLVDAGMRELNQTGFMHNRVRMVTASFLCKHLLIDWRRGERYFAQKLLDYDLSANVGNWQWAAGSGCDAAPYFRIFNPALQAKKFDPDLAYIKQWIPEYGKEIMEPIVDHTMARERCISEYKKALR
ncbi:MAG: DNA photolyase family protein [Spirochaetia bacterium]|nr:DNA photolyase family protein [Spirochaetia bacterium]